MPRKNNKELIAEMAAEIKELKKANKALEKLALIDPLTEVFNSRALEREGRRFSAEALRSGGYVCVLYTDIDDFGMINDLFGHDIGDAVLREFARILSSYFHRNIDIVSRKSGGSDEFICIWVAKNLKLTRKFVEKVRKRLSSIPLEKKSKLTFSSSVGFSLGKPAEISIEDLIKKADADMYSQKAKRKGKEK